MNDLRTNIEANADITFTAVWDLLRILLWVLVAWLFVDAVLTIALSFSVHRYTLDDVMKRIHRIERKLGIVEQQPVKKAVEEEKEAADEDKPVTSDEEPPPPPPSRD